jgi:hypothetical protein
MPTTTPGRPDPARRLRLVPRDGIVDERAITASRLEEISCDLAALEHAWGRYRRRHPRPPRPHLVLCAPLPQCPEQDSNLRPTP